MAYNNNNSNECDDNSNEVIASAKLPRGGGNEGKEEREVEREPFPQTRGDKKTRVSSFPVFSSVSFESFFPCELAKFFSASSRFSSFPQAFGVVLCFIIIIITLIFFFLELLFPPNYL